MAGVRDKELSAAGPWPAGINNAVAEDRVPTNEDGAPIALRDAQNIDLDKVGWPRRRKGQEHVYLGDLSHSLWSHDSLLFALFVELGVLHAFFPDESIQSLGKEVGDLPLSYALINDRIYFSNRAASGMVSLSLQVSSWAPDQPAGQPTVAQVAGYALTRGLYQVAVTFTDALGRESGCSRAVAVDVDDDHGLALSAIPQPADPSTTPLVNVYCSGPNDQVLRLATTIPAGISSGLIGSLAQGRSLTTQFLVPLPPGQIVRHANGRQLVAAGREVLYSEPLRYGLFHPVRNRVRFMADVDLVEPVGNDGWFVAAGKRTYWLAGRDPAEFSQVIRRASGAVKYSAARVPGLVLGLQTEEELPVWIASTGHFCVGTPGGVIVVLKEGEAVINDADRAAVLFRQQDGLQQILAALRGPRSQGLAVTDSVVAHVLFDGSAA